MPRIIAPWIADLILSAVLDALRADNDGDGVPDSLEAVLDAAERMAEDTRIQWDDRAVAYLRQTMARHPEWTRAASRRLAAGA